jgi:hypothetical protein
MDSRSFYDTPDVRRVRFKEGLGFVSRVAADVTVDGGMQPSS